MTIKTGRTWPRPYLSALPLRRTSEGEMLLRAELITAAEIRSATRRHSTEGSLAEGVHFFHSADGEGFYFVDMKCFRIATEALEAEGYIF